MLVPGLAAAHVAPDATDAQGAIAVAHFEFIDHNIGMRVAEPPGCFCTAIWTVLISALMVTTHRIRAASGLVRARGMATGMLEPYGAAMTGLINATIVKPGP